MIRRFRYKNTGGVQVHPFGTQHNKKSLPRPLSRWAAKPGPLSPAGGWYTGPGVARPKSMVLLTNSLEIFAQIKGMWGLLDALRLRSCKFSIVGVWAWIPTKTNPLVGIMQIIWHWVMDADIYFPNVWMFSEGSSSNTAIEFLGSPSIVLVYLIRT